MRYFDKTKQKQYFHERLQYFTTTRVWQSKIDFSSFKFLIRVWSNIYTIIFFCQISIQTFSLFSGYSFKLFLWISFSHLAILVGFNFVFRKYFFKPPPLGQILQDTVSNIVFISAKGLSSSIEAWIVDMILNFVERSTIFEKTPKTNCNFWPISNESPIQEFFFSIRKMEKTF